MAGSAAGGVGDFEHGGQAMMRLALVVVLLLASPGTASAESAWVLWELRSVSERGQVPAWRRVDTFNREAECRASALRQARSLHDTESREPNARARGLELRGTKVEVPIEFD